MRREVHVRFGEEKQGDSSTTPCFLLYSGLLEGRLFLSLALDLVSRRVLGWSMQPRMSAEPVTDALGDGGMAAPSWIRRCCIIPTRVANTRVRCFSACWSCTGLNAV